MNEGSPENTPPETTAEQDDGQHTRTLTDLLDELDRASFYRALASRDESCYATAAASRKRK